MNNDISPFDEFDFDDIDPDIDTTCLNCGYNEKVPNFIYDEFSKNKYHFKINKKVPTITCQSCGKETAISSFWLKK